MSKYYLGLEEKISQDDMGDLVTSTDITICDTNKGESKPRKS